MYTVSKLRTKKITVSVPASKSILNRALLLAALTEGDTLLRCGPFGDDSEALLVCLSALKISSERTNEGILVHGTRDFSRSATLDVGSAGTAARFLTAVLAFFGGEYELHASAQMTARPMELLPLLSSLGVHIEYMGEPEHFPFRMHSDGIAAGEAVIDTDVSTQYASGLMLAAALTKREFCLKLKGRRTDGSYLFMTSALIKAFGGSCERLKDGNGFAVSAISSAPEEYAVEPDVSGACYFYALSLLCNASVCVRGIHSDLLQGDLKFLDLLKSKGVRITDTEEGILADGTLVPYYNGIDEEMRDYSDQTMTVAVLAAFAESPSILRGVSHIRTQESDRMQAILENLNALGVRAFTDGDDIFIEPAPIRPCTVKTFGDHRIAMAFALAGLRSGGVTIDDPACCSKTFPHYFECIDQISK